MLPQDDFQRHLNRLLRAIVKTVPPLFALLSIIFLFGAFAAILVGAFTPGCVLGLMAATWGLLAWYGWKSMPDDDDNDYDDISYHGVPVEAPKPLDEDSTDKPYID